MTRRVVITGMGAITPLGHSVEDVWQALLQCKCNIKKTDLFDSSAFPTQFSAQVRNYNHLDYLPEKLHEENRNAARNSRFIIGAAMQAWQQARLPIPLNNSDANIPSDERIGVYLGAGEGPLDFDNFIAAIVDGWQSEKHEMDWGQWAKTAFNQMRSEERRVGKECRSRWSPYH